MRRQTEGITKQYWKAKKGRLRSRRDQDGRLVKEEETREQFVRIKGKGKNRAPEHRRSINNEIGERAVARLCPPVSALDNNSTGVRVGEVCHPRGALTMHRRVPRLGMEKSWGKWGIPVELTRPAVGSRGPWGATGLSGGNVTRHQ